jgi:ABC-type transporter Mla maintaining outer membrane lipid asymmetry ATPase subunit MlaF/ABC-type transporter Mla maintaining outer membrane lipid asymmetry permease subunit MlaE
LDSPTTDTSTDLAGGHDANHPVTVALESLTVRVAGRELLSDVTLEVLPGMITVIVGGSGAGKSVLLRILGGLVDAGDSAISQSGRIVIGSRRGDGDTDSLQPQSSARVGIVFQNFALFDQWSPKGNVQLAIDHRSDRSVPPEQSASGWLEELRVPQSTPVAVLSGGQKQRLAIARTLAAAPAIVLYDEPTSGLDSASGLQVAELIRRTQAAHRRTSIVVTHDYQTLLPIADDVLLLDSASKTLTRVPKDQWDTIAQRMQPVQQPASDSLLAESSPPSTIGDRIAAIGKRMLGGIDHRMTATGAVVLRLIDHLVDRNAHANNRRGLGMIRPWWISRFFGSFLRLVGGPSAMVYLAVAGMIVGFTATYFTFEFLPYRIYSKPLLIEDLLAAIGFALYRILVPVLATILIAARCGAAVAADVGVKRYGSQIEALKTLGIRPAIYLLVPIMFAFLLATPLLTALAFQVARVVSLVCFNAMHPELGPYFWHQHFHSRLISQWDDSGWMWVMAKTLICGAGIALISYQQGSRYKGSAGDVSDSITATVLWSTLFVLTVHFVVALIEF